MTLENIANKLIAMDDPIILIYAFNGSGKTQLSVAYKNETKKANEGEHSGVYYNAYSEDLFVWDNDEEHDGADIKLQILPSSLNDFHDFIYGGGYAETITEKLSLYNYRYYFRFNLYEDQEKGIESVTFYIDGEEDTPIKISRGEERIFVWCFYLALLEVDGWSDQQDAHIFIDDPVSSLDEHNVFTTAETLFQQIKRHSKKKKIIITTHHIGLFSILADRLTKGEKSDAYKHLTALQILKRSGDAVTLESVKNDVFLYHLHLLQVLDEAKNKQLYTYHFALLRQLLENISSFLGSSRIGRTLRKIGIEDGKVDHVVNVINTHSHKAAFYYQTQRMNQFEEELFKDVYERLNTKYDFTF